MKKTLALALALATAPFAAAGAELSYTWVEGGWNKVHVDEDDLGNPEADGAYLRGSYEFAPGLYAFGGAARVSDGENFGGLRAHYEIVQSELGLGYHQAMSDRVDFIAELAWVRQDAEAEVYGQFRDEGQATGGRGALGLRGRFSPNFEGLVKVNYYDGNDFDDGEFTGTVGAQYRISPTWGIAGEIEHGDLDDVDTTRFTLGVRASF